MSNPALNVGLSVDLVVGRIIDPPLQVQASVRGQVIILGFSNQATQQGVEVSFSEKAASDLIQLLTETVNVAKGQVGH